MSPLPPTSPLVLPLFAMIALILLGAVPSGSPAPFRLDGTAEVCKLSIDSLDATHYACCLQATASKLNDWYLLCSFWVPVCQDLREAIKKLDKLLRRVKVGDTVGACG